MHILITAGGTREYIDPVRFISNASTGKMGYALAQVATARGHAVTLITAPTSLKIPAKSNAVKVTTSKEMFEAVKEHFEECDCMIMAAAVSDYAPIRQAKKKLKKAQADLTLKLKPTTDILKWAGKNKKSRVVVGFALEDEAILDHAEKKMSNKNLDMIVANSPSAIGSDVSTVHIKKAAGDWTTIKDTPKKKISLKIIRAIEEL